MSNFILSCTTCSLRGVERDEVLAAIKYAPKAGYSSWGIAPPALWAFGGAWWWDASRAKKLADAAGLTCCTEIYGPNLPNGALNPEHAEDMAQMFRLADEIGAPLVVITGRRPRLDETEADRTQALDNGLAFMEALLPRIEGYKAKLALEPHHNSQLMTLEDYRYIFSRVKSDKIGITVDTGHFYSAGVDISAFIREFGGKVWNVHLKDHIGAQSVPIGEGEIDLRGMVKALDEINYSGALAVEIEPEEPAKLPGYCKDACAYLKKLVKEVTGQVC